jgi:hypothetical protein
MAAAFTIGNRRGDGRDNPGVSGGGERNGNGLGYLHRNGHESGGVEAVGKVHHPVAGWRRAKDLADSPTIFIRRKMNITDGHDPKEARMFGVFLVFVAAISILVRMACTNCQ